MNFITLSTLRTKLLAAHHLIIRQRIKFDIVWKSSKFLLEIRTLVSSANNIVSNIICSQGKVIYEYYDQQRP
jgi:hypothetical protein